MKYKSSDLLGLAKLLDRYPEKVYISLIAVFLSDIPLFLNKVKTRSDRAISLLIHIIFYIPGQLGRSAKKTTTRSAGYIEEKIISIFTSGTSFITNALFLLLLTIPVFVFTPLYLLYKSMELAVSATVLTCAYIVKGVFALFRQNNERTSLFISNTQLTPILSQLKKIIKKDAGKAAEVSNSSLSAFDFLNAISWDNICIFMKNIKNIGKIGAFLDKTWDDPDKEFIDALVNPAPDATLDINRCVDLIKKLSDCVDQEPGKAELIKLISEGINLALMAKVPASTEKLDADINPLIKALLCQTSSKPDLESNQSLLSAVVINRLAIQKQSSDYLVGKLYELTERKSLEYIRKYLVPGHGYLIADTVIKPILSEDNALADVFAGLANKTLDPLIESELSLKDLDLFLSKNLTEEHKGFILRAASTEKKEACQEKLSSMDIVLHLITATAQNLTDDPFPGKLGNFFRSLFKTDEQNKDLVLNQGASRPNDQARLFTQLIIDQLMASPSHANQASQDFQKQAVAVNDFARQIEAIIDRAISPELFGKLIKDEAFIGVVAKYLVKQYSVSCALSNFTEEDFQLLKTELNPQDKKYELLLLRIKDVADQNLRNLSFTTHEVESLRGCLSNNQELCAKLVNASDTDNQDSKVNKYKTELLTILNYLNTVDESGLEVDGLTKRSNLERIMQSSSVTKDGTSTPEIVDRLAVFVSESIDPFLTNVDSMLLEIITHQVFNFFEVKGASIAQAVEGNAVEGHTKTYTQLSDLDAKKDILKKALSAGIKNAAGKKEVYAEIIGYIQQGDNGKIIDWLVEHDMVRAIIDSLTISDEKDLLAGILSQIVFKFFNMDLKNGKASEDIDAQKQSFNELFKKLLSDKPEQLVAVLSSLSGVTRDQDPNKNTSLPIFLVSVGNLCQGLDLNQYDPPIAKFIGHLLKITFDEPGKELNIDDLDVFVGKLLTISATGNTETESALVLCLQNESLIESIKSLKIEHELQILLGGLLGSLQADAQNTQTQEALKRILVSFAKIYGNDAAPFKVIGPLLESLGSKSLTDFILNAALLMPQASGPNLAQSSPTTDPMSSVGTWDTLSAGLDLMADMKKHITDDTFFGGDFSETESQRRDLAALVNQTLATKFGEALPDINFQEAFTEKSVEFMLNFNDDQVAALKQFLSRAKTEGQKKSFKQVMADQIKDQTTRSQLDSYLSSWGPYSALAMVHEIPLINMIQGNTFLGLKDLIEAIMTSDEGARKTSLDILVKILEEDYKNLSAAECTLMASSCTNLLKNIDTQLKADKKNRDLLESLLLSFIGQNQVDSYQLNPLFHQDQLQYIVTLLSAQNPLTPELLGKLAYAYLAQSSHPLIPQGEQAKDKMPPLVTAALEEASQLIGFLKNCLSTLNILGGQESPLNISKIITASIPQGRLKNLALALLTSTEQTPDPLLTIAAQAHAVLDLMIDNEAHSLLLAEKEKADYIELIKTLCLKDKDKRGELKGALIRLTDSVQSSLAHIKASSLEAIAPKATSKLSELIEIALANTDSLTSLVDVAYAFFSKTEVQFTQPADFKQHPAASISELISTLLGRTSTTLGARLDSLSSGKKWAPSLKSISEEDEEDEDFVNTQDKNLEKSNSLLNLISWIPVTTLSKSKIISNPEHLTRVLNAICTQNYVKLLNSEDIPDIENLLIALLRGLNEHFHEDEGNSKLFVQSIINLMGLQGQLDSLQIPSDNLAVFISKTTEDLIYDESTPLNKLQLFVTIGQAFITKRKLQLRLPSDGQASNTLMDIGAEKDLPLKIDNKDLIELFKGLPSLYPFIEVMPNSMSPSLKELAKNLVSSANEKEKEQLMQSLATREGNAALEECMNSLIQAQYLTAFSKAPEDIKRIFLNHIYALMADDAKKDTLAENILGVLRDWLPSSAKSDDLFKPFLLNLLELFKQSTAVESQQALLEIMGSIATTVNVEGVSKDQVNPAAVNQLIILIHDLLNKSEKSNPSLKSNILSLSIQLIGNSSQDMLTDLCAKLLLGHQEPQGDIQIAAKKSISNIVAIIKGAVAKDALNPDDLGKLITQVINYKFKGNYLSGAAAMFGGASLAISIVWKIGVAPLNKLWGNIGMLREISSIHNALSDQETYKSYSEFLKKISPDLHIAQEDFKKIDPLLLLSLDVFIKNYKNLGEDHANYEGVILAMKRCIETMKLSNPSEILVYILTQLKARQLDDTLSNPQDRTEQIGIEPVNKLLKLSTLSREQLRSETYLARLHDAFPVPPAGILEHPKDPPTLLVVSPRGANTYDENASRQRPAP